MRVQMALCRQRHGGASGKVGPVTVAAVAGLEGRYVIAMGELEAWRRVQGAVPAGIPCSRLMLQAARGTVACCLHNAGHCL
jgi:hypothetical protein